MLIKTNKINKCNYGYSYAHKCNKKCQRKNNKYIRKINWKDFI